MGPLASCAFGSHVARGHQILYEAFGYQSVGNVHLGRCLAGTEWGSTDPGGGLMTGKYHLGVAARPASSDWDLSYSPLPNLRFYCQNIYVKPHLSLTPIHLWLTLELSAVHSVGSINPWLELIPVCAVCGRHSPGALPFYVSWILCMPSLFRLSQCVSGPIHYKSILACPGLLLSVVPLVAQVVVLMASLFSLVYGLNVLYLTEVGQKER